jgi:hypothetical protein
VLPAVLIGAPALTLLLFSSTWIVNISLSGIAFLGVTALAAQLLLHRGRLTEKRLISEWLGMPTTLLLQSTGPGSAPLRNQRRADVERVAGLTLPSTRRERDPPDDAREKIVHAVQRCIDRVRTGHDGSRLLQIENLSYGFRRNVRAGRAFGIVIAGLALITTALLTVSTGPAAPAITAVVINSAALLVWIFAVSDDWVRDQADKYANRFFRTIAA